MDENLSHVGEPSLQQDKQVEEGLPGKRRLLSSGRLAVILSLAPWIMYGLFLFVGPFRRHIFSDPTLGYALWLFMGTCGTAGFVSPFFAFRAMIRNESYEKNGLKAELFRGRIALVIFLLGIFFPFPTFFIGGMFRSFSEPKEYSHHEYRPEEDDLRSIFSSLTQAATKTPGQLLPKLSMSPGRLMHEYQDVFETASKRYPSPYISLHDPRRRELGEAVDFQATVDDSSFFYLGYEITSDEEMTAFAEAYLLAIEAGEGFEKDLQVTVGKGKEGSGILPRLSLARLPLSSDVKRPPLPRPKRGFNIPVLVERIRNHQNKGGYVMFLDGHVEYIEYPGRWPMTEHTVQLLDKLDRLEQSAINTQ